MIPGNRAAWLVGYSVGLIILSSLLVILRLISRRLSAARYWWDDALILVSLLASYPFYVGVMLTSGTIWNGKTFGYCLLRRFSESTQMITSITKTSILLFYLRLFGTPGTRPGFKKLLYITQALVVIWLFASVVSGIFRCHPIHVFWNPDVVGAPDFRHYCTSNETYYVSTSAFNVALDFWILMLPVSIVWTLQLSARRKVGLSAIFLLGGFVCGASIARAYTVSNVGLSDFSHNATPSIIWSSVEVSVGIICACLPTIQPVLQLFRRKVRNATQDRQSRRESSGLWYPKHAARGGRQENTRVNDGTCGTLNEELATLRPTYSSSKSASEGFGMWYGTAVTDNSKDMPIRANKQSTW